MTVRRNLIKTYYKLAPAFKNSDEAGNDKSSEIYEQVMFYLPYSPSMSLTKILGEVRKLFLSDILSTDTANT